MSRVSARIARQMREQWAAELSGVRPRDQQAWRGGVASGRGSDYREADDRWVCNRKKAYPDEAMAKRVASRMNDRNAFTPEREEFRDVIVRPYECGRCGRWHLGR